MIPPKKSKFVRLLIPGEHSLNCAKRRAAAARLNHPHHCEGLPQAILSSMHTKDQSGGGGEHLHIQLILDTMYLLQGLKNYMYTGTTKKTILAGVLR